MPRTALAHIREYRVCSPGPSRFGRSSEGTDQKVAMKVVLRADAAVSSGSGHVVRCLTLIEELRSRGHEAVLMTAPSGIDWLRSAIDASNVEVVATTVDSLDRESILAMAPDWVVVDSYRIPSERVTSLAQDLPVLAVVDGDTRGVGATLYVDQNLGSEAHNWPAATAGRMLAGARFALVREDILARRRARPWVAGRIPRVVAVMGGTDPSAAIVDVAGKLAGNAAVDLVIVAPQRLVVEVASVLGDETNSTVIPATPDLPELLAGASIVVSAAGTSSWDVCSLAIPSVLVGLVDNQSDLVDQAVLQEVALGINVYREGPGALGRLGGMVTTLAGDRALRERLSRRCSAVFDGRGKERVVDEMEERSG